MKINIDKSWKDQLKSQFKQPYFKKLLEFISKEYDTNIIFPPKKELFTAFNLCTFDTVRVVILGQDPYHGANQAHGLCFSVNKDVRTPPSLKNIYKELATDVQKEIPDHGDLRDWAKQGVLLINATLTVEQKKPGSHQKKGWEQFTDEVIKTISTQKEHVVFLLWGNFAKSKIDLIDQSKHLVLTTTHPSPFSAYRGFLGCKHFSKTNTYLKKMGLKPIKW
mgnify:CR=1 FL=1